MKYRIAALAALLPPALVAQTAQADAIPAAPGSDASNEEVIVLSPFEVSATATSGYAASTTLAGNRLNTELRDIGSAVSVVTSEFLKDVGATDNRTLLQYTTSSEVGGTYGNFGGTGDGAVLDESSKFITPNTNTRVRGLAAADNTRDFFMTSIPWDGYNVDGVDLQRGANSILFGMGSPAGIINTRSKQAMFTNANEIGVRVGSYGANRQTVDFNRVLIDNQLAIRIAALRNDDQFKQDPAFSKDERVYGAIRFEPAFLKKNGMRTILKANYEAGRVRSNNPRTLPPIDMITPWFRTGTYAGKDVDGNDAVFANLNRATFVPLSLVNDNTPRQGHGQVRQKYNGPSIGADVIPWYPKGINGGQPNPNYNPWVGNFAQQFGGPMVFFQNNSATPAQMLVFEPRQEYAGAINSAGGIDAGHKIDGQRWQRPGSIAPYASYAKNAGLPFSDSGVYKDFSITDSSIFDFYNQLLDGPNKKEWQDFRAYNISLAQTFLDDQVGFELSYNNEFYKQGRLSLLSGERQAIYVDINRVYGDGTPAGIPGTRPDGLDREPYGDGTPNPNVGKAFISDNGQGNNSSLMSEKANMRATVFATLDFEKLGKNWFTKFLGKHTATGLFASDEDETDNRSWVRYTADDAFAESIRSSSVYKINANEVVPNTVIYLGDSLINRESASGAYLPNPTEVAVAPSGTVRTFVGIWNKPTDPSDPNYVNPGAEWIDPYYPIIAPWNDPTKADYAKAHLTQSENPANYVGWSNVPLTWSDSESSDEARLHNTTSARKALSRVTSSAFVWQGKFLDNAIVGTWGVRKDIAKSWTVSNDSNNSSWTSEDETRTVQLANARGVLNWAPYELEYHDIIGNKNSRTAFNRLQMTSHSWMVVAHLMDLPGLKKALEKSPVQVSLFYNESSNFQPAASRVDIYGHALPPPTGTTTDKGILLETRDGKYSLKINRYETSSKNNGNDALAGNMWFIGASQTWSGNWANQFENNWTGWTPGTAANPADPRATQYNYEPSQRERDLAKANGFPGGTPELDELATAEAWRLAGERERSAVAAWRTWQNSVNPDFYAAWGIDLQRPFTSNEAIGASAPAGVTVTEDSISKGYEVEFNAQITKNWRLTFNGAKTTAVRNNVGGAALSDFVSKYEEALNGGVGSAGDLRIWWGGAGNETTRFQWNQNFGSTYHMLKLLEGTNVPELRKWRFNLITNYDFDSGFMKGFNVGAGVRYESSVGIGYPVLSASGTTVEYDLASPYKGDAETNFDFWVGYRRTIWKNLDWSIQLNVRNAFVGNELIPITTQPDGTPAGYRIRPPQTWQLSNTFRF